MPEHGGGGGGGRRDRADREAALHLRRVRVALEEVRPVGERDREGLVADECDVGRDSDAGAGEVEVVEVEWSWMTSVYVPGIEVLDRGALMRP